MDIQLSEAARLLDKSESQVRYMIKSGRLQARKAGGRWRIRREDLPLSAGQLRAAERKLERAAEIAAEVLRPGAKGGKKSLSLRSLRAMEGGAEVYRRLVEDLGRDHSASEELHEALLLLSCGYYEYSPAEKAGFYTRARQHASRAAGELLLTGTAKEQAHLERLEAELSSQPVVVSAGETGRRRGWVSRWVRWTDRPFRPIHAASSLSPILL